MLARLSFCALVGSFVGVIVGSLYVELLAEPSVLAMSAGSVLVTGAVLGVVVWLVLLFILGGFLRYRVGPLAAPALLNAVITGALTARFVHLAAQPLFATVIGFITGLIVGGILCLLCRRWEWLTRKHL